VPIAGVEETTMVSFMTGYSCGMLMMAVFTGAMFVIFWKLVLVDDISCRPLLSI